MVQTLNKNVTELINITVRLTDGSEILLRYMTHATKLSPCPENLHSEWFWFVQRPIIVVIHVQNRFSVSDNKSDMNDLDLKKKILWFGQRRL